MNNETAIKNLNAMKMNYDQRDKRSIPIRTINMAIEALEKQIPITRREVVELVSKTTITKETLIYTPLGMSLENYMKNHLASLIADQIKEHMEVETTTNPLSGDREYMARIWVLKERK